MVVVMTVVAAPRMVVMTVVAAPCMMVVGGHCHRRSGITSDIGRDDASEICSKVDDGWDSIPTP